LSFITLLSTWIVPVSTTDVVVTGTTGSSARAGDIVNDVNAMAVANARDFEYLIVILRTSDSRICTREKIPFAFCTVDPASHQFD
jgi:hypothetical protein